MSQEIEKILYNGLNEMGESIAEAIRQYNLSDTGDSQMFEVEINGNRLTLYGVPYLIYLVNGRPPGKFPPVEKIREYVERNRISFEFNGRELTSNQVAYLIGRGIAEKGTRIYRGEIEGLPLDTLINDKLDEIMPKIADQAALNIVSTLTK